MYTEGEGDDNSKTYSVFDPDSGELKGTYKDSAESELFEFFEGCSYAAAFESSTGAVRVMNIENGKTGIIDTDTKNAESTAFAPFGDTGLIVCAVSSGNKTSLFPPVKGKL